MSGTSSGRQAVADSVLPHVFGAVLACGAMWPASAGSQPRFGEGVRVEGVAAIVGGLAPGPGVDVVLRSDVSLRARIRVAGKSDATLPTGELPARLLRDTLQEIVGETLIAREADRIRVDPPGEAELAEQRRRLAKQAGGAERLDRLLRAVGAEPEEVDVIVRRRALVQAFLEANLEGVSVVPDARVERVYETEEHPFTDRPLDEVREELRAWIAHRAIDRAVGRWVKVLRNRTEVRILAEY